jgi:exopolysaccharide biosynthesis polyprenyl glycosylphosphotransferase
VASKDFIRGTVEIDLGLDGEPHPRVGGPNTGSRGLMDLSPLRRSSPQRTQAKGPAASTRRDSLFRRMLLAADLLAATYALVLTVRLSAGSLRLAWLSPIALLFVLLVSKLLGLYDRDEALINKTTLDELPKLVHLATLCVLFCWLAGGLIFHGTLDPHQALLMWLLLAALLTLTRTCARAMALNIAPVERCLFIGEEQSARAIGPKLLAHGAVKAKMVAHLDLKEIALWSTNACSADRLSEIRDLAQELDVHRAIIAPRSADAGEMLDLMCTLKAVGVRVSLLPRLLEVVGSSVQFDDLHGVTMMGVKCFDMTRSSSLVKRVFDLIGASLGLLMAGPLMIAIAVAIKLDSRGQVFFGQLRVGRHGEHFEMLKFRTMVHDADALKDSLRHRNEAQEGLFKIADDPRVTRVGRLLRKSALDELPQLLNILKGQMSLVGPRPLVIEEDQRVEGWHRRRLELTPGMTGHWQILGPARVPLIEMVAIDYLYVANWSLWTDIKILLRTIPHVLGRRGL